MGFKKYWPGSVSWGAAVDGLVFGRYVVEDPEPASVVAALREALDSIG